MSLLKGINFENASIEEIEQSELTYDGEHLKYEGYVDWFKYIDKKIDGGIYQNLKENFLNLFLFCNHFNVFKSEFN